MARASMMDQSTPPADLVEMPRTALQSRREFLITSAIAVALIVFWLGVLALDLIAHRYGVAHFYATFRGHAATVAQRNPLTLWTMMVLYLLPSIIFIATAILLVYKRPLNVVAILIAITLLCFDTTQLLAADFWIKNYAQYTSQIEWMKTYTRYSSLIEHVGVLSLIISSLIFPDGRFVPRWSAAIALAGFVYVACLTIWELPGTLSVPIDTIIECAALATLLLRMSASTGVGREQIRWAATGVGIFILSYAMFNLLSPVLQRSSSLGIRLIPGFVLTFGLLWLGLGFLVALLRHRLFDLNFVISRSLVYAALVGGAGILFLIAQGSLGEMLKRPIPDEDARHLILGIIAAGLIAPLRSTITAWADRRFRAPLLKLTEGLPAWFEQVRRFVSLEEIKSEIESSVSGALRCGYVDVQITETGQNFDGAPRKRPGKAAKEVPANSGDHLDDQGDTERIPLRISGTDDGPVVGWLLVGPRIDEAKYAPDERQALKEVAQPIARAIRDVQLRDAIIQGLAARLPRDK
jgi:hypothetical protein